MIWEAKKHRVFDEDYPTLLWVHQDDHVIAYKRGGLLLAFNFSPDHSHVDYGIPAGRQAYQVLFSTDDYCYGGWGRNARDRVEPDEEGKIRLYLPARTALVLYPVSDRA
jgi:1,4-alpha-glucan branching enzyme